MVKRRIISGLKRTANRFGFAIERLSKVPRHNALGLRTMGIRTVIDVGANVGQFARYIRSVLPEARIICFEPLREPFQNLSAQASKQNGWINAYNVALGEREGSAVMFQHVDFSPSSSLLHATPVSHFHFPFTKRETPLNVRITSLDKFIEESKMVLEPEILIKLDVQGYEDRVIKGAYRTFTSARACISEINFDALYEGQCTFGEVWKLLDSLGYRYAGNLDQVYAADGHIIFGDVLFLR